MIGSLRVAIRQFREAVRPMIYGVLVLLVGVVGLAVFEGLRVSILLSVCGAILIAVGVRRYRKIARVEQKRVVHTERLTIRPLRPADAEAFVATIADDVVTFNGLTDHFAEEARQSIAKGRRQAHLAICTAADEIIGGCVIHPNTEPPRRCEISLWIAEPHRRQGYALEAINGFTFRLHRNGFRDVTGQTAVDNAAGRALLIRAGYDHEGDERVTLENGFSVDAAMYLHRLVAAPSAGADAVRNG